MKSPEYFRYNASKPKFVRQWATFTFIHPDNAPLYYVVVELGVEPDFDYTFEGIKYTPVSASFSYPKESTEDNGKMTLTFPRAGTDVKRFMANITPQNVKKPISCQFKLYQEGAATPVRTYSGNVSKNYPVISGRDVKIQIDTYNPSRLKSQDIVTLDLAPELAQS